MGMRMDTGRQGHVRERARQWLRRGSASALAGLLGLAAPAHAEPQAEQAGDVWEALTEGSPILNVRGRIELAKTEGLERSEAYTVRTRLGYATKPIEGVRVLMEFENIASATGNTFFDPTQLPNSRGQTVIADPPSTAINRGLVEIHRPDWLDTRVVGGRQRIVFDDARFIGDVVWRQNQQTYDAAYVETALGQDDLAVRYGYVGRVKRIFGGGGNNPLLRDFDSDSHIVNASFTRFQQARLVGFAYLLDLTLPGLPNASANSSKTFGARATGDVALGERLGLGYQASYAYQSEYAGKTPAYDAHYALGDVNLGWKEAGTVGVGFEWLDSDGGQQQFLTPLSTAHKFNGWADVFLDNGGPNGLRDLYVYAAPALPWKLKTRLVYHRFWSDATGAVYGNEFDAVLVRPFGKYVQLLVKGAYFVSVDGGLRPTTWRVDFDLTIAI